MIGEVALSIVLLVAAGLMIRSFFAVTHVDLGFDAQHLLFMPVGSGPERYQTPQQADAFLQKVVESVKPLPGVVDVAINNSLPGYNPGSRHAVTMPGSTYSERVGFDACSESLKNVLGLHVTRGRWFSPGDVDSAQHEVVVNETMMRHFFGNTDPIGRQIVVKHFDETSASLKGTEFQVIGVVRDIKNFGPQAPVLPMGFVPWTLGHGGILLIRTSRNPALLMRVVQQQVWAVDQQTMFSPQYGPLKNTLYDLTYWAPEFGVKSLGSLASIALLLVVVGVFSVMAYAVALQTHDIGIRMALGAQQHDS